MTRRLVVADDRATAVAWAERNVRFTIGFDDVVKASVQEVVDYLEWIEPAHDTGLFEGVVLVRSPGPHPPPPRLLRALRLVVDDANIVVAPAPLATTPGATR